MLILYSKMDEKYSRIGDFNTM